MRSSKLVVGTALLAALAGLSFSVVASTPNQTPALAKNAKAVKVEKNFSFGLWGDMPYKKAGDDAKLPNVLASINQSSIDFSIYDGDIKDGSSKCTDDIYSDAITMFNSMKKPVVYVPGDNEWTDCHRLNNGGMDSLERLNYVRSQMYPSLNSFGKTTLALQHQGALKEKFVENTRFIYSGIVFAGFNMPGSNNNKVLNEKDCTQKSARTPLQCEAANQEYLERDKANISWMQEAFNQAKQSKAKGIVLVVQGDPGFDLPETEDLDETTLAKHSGYTEFMKQLAEQTQNFEGQVLFVHGDTHFFKQDKPLFNPGKMLTNFTRLQTFGSPSLHWVKVNVNLNSPNIFAIEPVVVKH